MATRACAEGWMVRVARRKPRSGNSRHIDSVIEICALDLRTLIRVICQMRAPHPSRLIRLIAVLVVGGWFSASVAQAFVPAPVHAHSATLQVHHESAATVVLRPASLPWTLGLSNNRASTFGLPPALARYAMGSAAAAFLLRQSLSFWPHLALVKIGYHGHIATAIPPPSSRL